jgi:uncharacterized membrane protein
MKLNVRALAITAGVIWAAGVFLVALANLIWPSYGQEFLAGAIFAWIYNWLATPSESGAA